jgi:hypothetical protein
MARNTVSLAGCRRRNGMAGVRADARDLEAVETLQLFGKIDDRIPRGQTAPMEPRVHFEENIEVNPVSCRRFSKLLRGFEGIDGNGESRTTSEMGQTIEFLYSEDWVANQDVIDACGGHHFSLTNLGHRHATRTGSELQVSERGNLVGLDMRAEFDASVTRKLRHRANVPFHAWKVDEQNRCV